MSYKKPFTEVVLQEGVISTLLGLPGAGKTNVATFLMQQAVKHGFTIYTNIHFFNYSDVPKAIRMGRLPPLPGTTRYTKKPSEIQTITTISDLLVGLLTTAKNTTFIDEAGFFATSSMATSKKVRQLKELAYIIRHLNSSLVIIAQSKGSIVPDLRRTLLKYELNIDKVSSKYRVLHINTSVPYFNKETGEKEVRMKEIDKIGHIPMATIPWDGYFLPKFKFDIDLSEAFDQLGEYNSVEVLTKGKDIIKGLKKDTKAGGTKKTTLRKKQEETYEEVRELFKTLEDSGMFKNRTALLANIAKDYKRTTQWAWSITRDLSFDKSKYNPDFDPSEAG